MKINNLLGNLAIKKKMFVFYKENHASICICSYEHFSFLELPGINGVDVKI